MKQITLALMGLAFATGCSQQGGEQRAPAEDELTRPLEVARVDTAQPGIAGPPRSSDTQAASAQPAPKKAQRPTPKAPPRRAAKPAELVADDTAEVQGYAPDSGGVSAAAETTAAAARDTASFIVDTIPSSRIDSAVAGGDTADNPALESATRDSEVTTSTTPPDTGVGRNSEPVRSASAPAPDSAPRPATAAAPPEPATRPAPVATPPAPTASAAARTLPVGTEIHAALDDSINSRNDTVGRTVTAVVMENIIGADGKTLIRAGAPVRFTVTRLSPARSKSAQGRLRLKVDGIGVGNELRQVTADVRPVPHELRGRGVTAGDAAKVGVGAAGGAVIGKVVGKSTEAAVIGGVVGAAGGAVVASQTATRDVFVKARTPVVLRLTQPLLVQ